MTQLPQLKYLKQILPNIYQTPVEFPFGPDSVKTHAYIIQRSNGDKYDNFMIFGTCHMEKCYDDVQSIGGISRIYINHRDEASPYHKIGYDLYKAPSYCHSNEFASIQEKTKLVHNKSLFTFDNENNDNKNKEFDDFDIIPAPGHTSGATMYRWRNNNKQYLFTGDTLYTAGPIGKQQWEIAPLYIHPYIDKKKDMINTLQMLTKLHFDYLVPGLHGHNDTVDCYDVIKNDEYKNEILLKILDQVNSKLCIIT